MVVNKPDHPWKKPFSPKKAIADKINQKHLDKYGITIKKKEKSK